jgi:hypothetical protein
MDELESGCTSKELKVKWMYDPRRYIIGNQETSNK